MQEPLDSHETREGLIPDKDELMWSTFAHLGFLAGLIIPFGNVVAPLVIWLVYKDRSSYVEYHSKEALNFQLTVTIAMVASGILVLLLIGKMAVGVIVTDKHGDRPGFGRILLRETIGRTIANFMPF